VQCYVQVSKAWAGSEVERSATWVRGQWGFSCPGKGSGYTMQIAIFYFYMLLNDSFLKTSHQLKDYW